MDEIATFPVQVRYDGIGNKTNWQIYNRVWLSAYLHYCLSALLPTAKWANNHLQMSEVMVKAIRITHTVEGVMET